MPRQPVHDLVIHPRDNDLVVGTHGRGIFISDLSPLQEMTAATLKADAHLFDVRPAIMWAGPGLSRASSSHNFEGPSRRPGATLNYWLASAPSGDVRIRIYDGARLVHELAGTKHAGLNTVSWDLSRFVRERTDAEKQAARGARGGRGGAVHPTHITVPGMPGAYRVALVVNGRTIEKPVVVTAEAARK